MDGKTDRRTDGRKTGCLYRTLLKQVRQKARNVEIPHKQSFATAANWDTGQQWRKNMDQGDIIRERRQTELSFLYVTPRTQLSYDPTKYHWIFLTSAELCSGNKMLVPTYLPADIHQFNSQCFLLEHLVPVVQSIVSITSSLRGQLINCFMTLWPNTLIFFVEKMREAFALQKLLTFFQPKILAYIRY